MNNKFASGLVLHPPKRLGHLGVIADLLRSVGVLDVIDAACGLDVRMRVRHGDCALVVLLGVFAGEHGLWRLTDRLDPYDMATLTRDPAVNLDDFHDVRLGRMLDAIWALGVFAVKWFSTAFFRINPATTSPHASPTNYSETSPPRKSK